MFLLTVLFLKTEIADSKYLKFVEILVNSAQKKEEIYSHNKQFMRASVNKLILDSVRIQRISEDGT